MNPCARFGRFAAQQRDPLFHRIPRSVSDKPSSTSKETHLQLASNETIQRIAFAKILLLFHSLQGLVLKLNKDLATCKASCPCHWQTRQDRPAWMPKCWRGSVKRFDQRHGR